MAGNFELYLEYFREIKNSEVEIFPFTVLCTAPKGLP